MESFLLNDAPRGKLAGEALKGQGILVADTILHQRAAYSHAVIDGRSVHEYEPDGKAAAKKQLDYLTLEQETTQHALLTEALNDLFKKYGKEPIA